MLIESCCCRVYLPPHQELTLASRPLRTLSAFVVTQSDNSIPAINFWRKQLLEDGELGSLVVAALHRLLPHRNHVYDSSLPMLLELTTAHHQVVHPSESGRAQRAADAGAAVDCVCGDTHSHNRTLQCDFCGGRQHYNCVVDSLEDGVPDGYICFRCGPSSHAASVDGVTSPAAALGGVPQASLDDIGAAHPHISCAAVPTPSEIEPLNDSSCSDVDAAAAASRGVDGDLCVNIGLGVGPELASSPDLPVDGVGSVSSAPQHALPDAAIQREDSADAGDSPSPRAATVAMAEDDSGDALQQLLTSAWERLGLERRWRGGHHTLPRHGHREPPPRDEIDEQAGFTVPHNGDGAADPSSPVDHSTDGDAPDAGESIDALVQSAVVPPASAPKAAPQVLGFRERKALRLALGPAAPTAQPARPTIFDDPLSLVWRMHEACDEDEDAMAAGSATSRTASYKTLLPEVVRWRSASQERLVSLLDCNFLTAARRWLRIGADGRLPDRGRLVAALTLLQSMQHAVTLAHLKRSGGLVRVVRQYETHPDVFEINAALCRDLNRTWSALLSPPCGVPESRVPASRLAKRREPDADIITATPTEYSVAKRTHIEPVLLSPPHSVSSSKWCRGGESLSPLSHTAGDATLMSLRQAVPGQEFSPQAPPRRRHCSSSAGKATRRPFPVSTASAVTQANCKQTIAAMIKSKLRDSGGCDSMSRDTQKQLLQTTTREVAGMVKKDYPSDYACVPFIMPLKLALLFDNLVEAHIARGLQS